MNKKQIYNSGFPALSVTLCLLPLAIMTILTLNGMDLIATIFYGQILIFTAFLLNRNNQWIRLYADHITIVNFNPFLGTIEIPYDSINKIETEDGIEMRFIMGTITGVPDRIYIKHNKREKTESTLIRTVGLNRENPLFKILTEKVKIKTPPNNCEHP